jgi:hypothetical protein
MTTRRTPMSLEKCTSRALRESQARSPAKAGLELVLPLASAKWATLRYEEKQGVAVTTNKSPMVLCSAMSIAMVTNQDAAAT